ncbi:MAG: hypothetical protein FGM24_02465 [Candidatus Kapabacteria bacterium]|nr:hypothetical protein [Candidatus Kapabacteria bacterium]
MASVPSARPQSLSALTAQLTVVQRRFDESSIIEHEHVLAALANVDPTSARAAQHLHDALLFSLAYAPTANIYDLADQVLKRCSAWIGTHAADDDRLSNSGLPDTPILASFSRALATWLVHHAPGRVSVDASYAPSDTAVPDLVLTLDPTEQEMLVARPTTWESWCRDVLRTDDGIEILHRTLALSRRLPGSVTFVEQLWARWNVVLRWQTSMADAVYGLARPSIAPVAWHHDGLVRHVSLEQAFAQGAPKPIRCTSAQRTQLCDVAKGVLASMQRETDPVTHADEAATELFDMGRGLAIALYYARPEQKMSLQSYVGYMAFKNRVPIAYGGGWVMGAESGFGVNIFPPFRGGESSNIVAQLLRLYAHHFGVRSFTVDPYQIGAGNPDGIASASFWFYYRLGFRPMQDDLAELARREFELLTTSREARTSRSVLRTLANASMRWTHPDATAKPITADAMAEVVAAYVEEHADGDRRKALRRALARLSGRTGERYGEGDAIARIAVLLVACGYVDTASAAAIRSFVRDYRGKFVDERTYCRRAVRHTLLYDCLHRAEQALRNPL